MTKEEKKKIRLARAKRTALGRFLCRLFGDNAGQAMMEYVVIGVLVVAAVVAIVILFGEQIANGFDAMIAAIQGKPRPQTNVDTQPALDTRRDIAPGSGDNSTPSSTDP